MILWVSEFHSHVFGTLFVPCLLFQLGNGLLSAQISLAVIFTQLNISP